MRKKYNTPLSRIVGLDPDELLQMRDASTNLDDTGFGGDTDGEMEADTRHTGIWRWDINDD